MFAFPSEVQTLLKPGEEHKQSVFRRKHCFTCIFKTCPQIKNNSRPLPYGNKWNARLIGIIKHYIQLCSSVEIIRLRLQLGVGSTVFQHLLKQILLVSKIIPCRANIIPHKLLLIINFKCSVIPPLFFIFIPNRQIIPEISQRSDHQLSRLLEGISKFHLQTLDAFLLIFSPVKT